MVNPIINYDQLHVDKANTQVFYNDQLHKYWTKDTKQSCISVTTLIHQFTSFDEEFWSKYKTLEALVTAEDFKTIKPELLDNKKFKKEYLDRFELEEVAFEERREALLKEWEIKRETSCIRGTAIHREQELLHLAGQTKEIQQLGLGGKFACNTSNIIEPGYHIYPELLLSRISDDGKLRLAGQADLIIVDDYDVLVLDYKTNAKIEMKSYFDRKNKKSVTLKYPLNHIQDSNFWHYTLQLSTYAWMIQKHNPKFNIKLLMLIHYDHNGGVTNYECEYLKNDVEKMLAFYKKQMEHEEFKKSRAKIEF